MKGGPTDPPNPIDDYLTRRATGASMKGGPTDPPNRANPWSITVLAALQ